MWQTTVRESELDQLAITMPKEVPMKTQERAYTSPIWYTPTN